MRGAVSGVGVWACHPLEVEAVSVCARLTVGLAMLFVLPLRLESLEEARFLGEVRMVMSRVSPL